MIKIIVILLHLLSVLGFSQVIYVPVSNGVYDFMERLSLKNVININDEVKPFSRKYIAYKIASIIPNNDLTHLEKEELRFYLKEFAYELNISSERWFLYSYSDSLFRLRISPVAGYGVSKTGNYTGFTRWPGINVYGSYGKNFGAFFEYKDIGEFGDNVDRKKTVSQLTGHFYKGAANGIEYSDIRGGMSYDFGWGSLSILKDYTQWGHGQFGNLILSKKPASFPQIRFHLNPVEWLRFSYIHGWLNSLIQDSSSFYYNNLDSREPFLRENYIDKYIAGNLLTVSPVHWLDLSVGNSYIYSGGLRAEMFIPFMFYKAMDHNMGRGEVGSGNGQIYIDVAIKYPRTFEFYSTLLIDVLDDRDIKKNIWYTSWFGYTIGLRKTDLLVENAGFRLEYSKTNPWVYENKDESSNYKHINYPLGHWIGQNADHFRVQIDYVLLRGLKSAVYFERLRKGGMNDIVDAYKSPEYIPFLSGMQRKDLRYGIKITYEIIHDLMVKGEYEYSDISDEDVLRTPTFMLGRKNNFSLLIYYGMN